MSEAIGAALVPEGEDYEYALVPDCAGVWVRIDGISVHLRRHDDGVSVDLYGHAAEDVEALASTWATFGEAAEARAGAPR
jgi:hypothetical protein